MNKKMVEILLIEDNPGDIELTQMAFEESDLKYNLSVIRDGEKAMQFLFEEAGQEEIPYPNIILLDINLPIKNGFDILIDIKKDEKLRMIPVLILTTSDAEKDIYKAYSNHANAFLNKPVDFNEFIQKV